MRKLLIIPVIMLQGCAYVQNGSFEYAENPPDMNYLPIGIPFLLGGHGTAVPITDDVSITAAHVAKYDYSTVIAYHPDCDVALIKSDNSEKEKVKLGLIHDGETVTNYGYGLTGGRIEGTGEYVMDVTMDGNTKCLYSLNTAPQKSGMSGGAVLNDSGELVGVIHGIGFEPPVMDDTGERVELDRYSYFVSVNFVKNWIYKHVPSLKE